MSRSLRRLATFILLLTVPLRVYAAAAMVFCSPGIDAAGSESLAPAHHAAPAASHVAHAPVGHSAHDHSAANSHHPEPDAASFHDHFSCAGCCCAGMIAAASFDWKPQAFPTPAIASFIAYAVPSTVPHRLERPPRTIFA